MECKGSFVRRLDHIFDPISASFIIVPFYLATYSTIYFRSFIEDALTLWTVGN